MSNIEVIASTFIRVELASSLSAHDLALLSGIGRFRTVEGFRFFKLPGKERDA